MEWFPCELVLLGRSPRFLEDPRFNSARIGHDKSPLGFSLALVPRRLVLVNHPRGFLEVHWLRLLAVWSWQDAALSSSRFLCLCSSQKIDPGSSLVSLEFLRGLGRSTLSLSLGIVQDGTLGSNRKHTQAFT